jgi:hypothetical protein
MRRQWTRGVPTRQRPVAAAMLTTVFLLLSSCVVYEPAPTYGPAPRQFDRAWNAALAAAQDEGIRILAEDWSRCSLRRCSATRVLAK